MKEAISCTFAAKYWVAAVVSCHTSIDVLPPAALPGAKLLKKFDQNFS
jgi:hypothetical protein